MVDFSMHTRIFFFFPIKGNLGFFNSDFKIMLKLTIKYYLS